MKTAQVGSKSKESPSKVNGVRDRLLTTYVYFIKAVWIWSIWDATTESTSTSILLNSSKQAHAPQQASPRKNFPMVSTSSCSEQLKTRHYFARALARSFVVSVLPVPAGPSGAPPRHNCNATMRVLKQRSVRGVITSLGWFPKYSKPNRRVAVTILASNSSYGVAPLPGTSYTT